MEQVDDRKYLDPPDPDPVCEDGCGETLQHDITGEWVCVNKYCPLKFDEGSTAREMAEMLIGAQETIKSMRRKFYKFPARLDGQE